MISILMFGFLSHNPDDKKRMYSDASASKNISKNESHFVADRKGMKSDLVLVAADD